MPVDRVQRTAIDASILPHWPPNASRAVGSALAADQIDYLIPCHQVIRQTGSVGKYRWGRVRKQVMLGRQLSSSDRVDLPA